MSLTTYTTYEEVRAVLGVSATELPNAVLSQPLYDFHMRLAFEDVAEGVPAMYEMIKTLQVSVTTDAQKRFLTIAGLYAPYALAKHLLTSLPMFAVQSLTDGRASFDRPSNIAIYDDVKADVTAALADLLARFRAVYFLLSGVVPAAVTRVRPTLVIASRLATDPVTNV